jgi:hypothetical protein
VENCTHKSFELIRKGVVEPVAELEENFRGGEAAK